MNRSIIIHFSPFRLSNTQTLCRTYLSKLYIFNAALICKFCSHQTDIFGNDNNCNCCQTKHNLPSHNENSDNIELIMLGENDHKQLLEIVENTFNLFNHVFWSRRNGKCHIWNWSQPEEKHKTGLVFWWFFLYCKER